MPRLGGYTKEMLSDNSKWKVYSSVGWRSSWKWVAMFENTVMDIFPTKTKAYEFINSFTKEEKVINNKKEKRTPFKSECIIAGITFYPNMTTADGYKNFVRQQRAYYRRFWKLCKDNKIEFTLEDGNGYNMCDFDKPRKTECERVGENFQTWYFDEFQDIYYQLKKELS
jgi:hypothetical protein